MINMTDKFGITKMVAESQIFALSKNMKDGLTYYKNSNEFVLGTDTHSSQEALNRTISILAEYADASNRPYIRINDYSFFYKSLLAEVKVLAEKKSIGFVSVQGKFLAYITIDDPTDFEAFAKYILEELSALPEGQSASL
ncbi:hypothetical protein O1Y80_000797 [Yersinia enterocolitica]|nr:hypothetical protein [Yersinia enterocolitica]EKN3831207.1 hypothetical protein [Yersinia enterocolitica]